MNDKKITATTSHNLMQEEGYRYVDVRTPEEYEAGHPEGAFNVPFMLRDPNTMQMVLNGDFVQVMVTNFTKTDALIVGCQVGGRSARAAAVLESEGFQNILDNTTGYKAARDGTPGWMLSSLPTEEGHVAERCYEDLKAKG